MAKGKTHDKITIILSPIVFWFLWKISLHLNVKIRESLVITCVGVIVYIFSGYMFSGDLDIKSSEYYRWGMFKLIWIPYQKIFSHRSIFTHGFILGPIIRLVYLFIIYLLVCALLYSLDFINLSTEGVINRAYLFIIRNKYFFFIMYLAISLGAGIHTLTDLFYSFVNKRFNIKIKIKRRFRLKKNRKKRRINGGMIPKMRY